MFQIKQSDADAAHRRIPVLLVDITDGFTPELGVTAPTINVSKNGATPASGAGTWAEIGNGQYYYQLTTGEVDTLGWVSLNIEKATVSRDYNSVVQIMAYDPFDTVRIGLTALPNAAAGASGGLPTGNASGQVTVGSLAATAQTDTAGAVWNALLASYTTANSFGARVVRTRSTSPSNEVTITGSFHIAADVHELQPAVITAADFATGAIDANALNATALAAIADYLLLRKLDRTGQGTGSTANERTVLSALRYLRNKVDISASTMTITTEDDTTTAWTATLSSTAGLNPVTGIDPA